MSRKSYRILFSAFILIASLVVALPADAAGRADRVSASRESLWSALWDWVGTLLGSTTSGDGDPDRGILIDPNGGPGR